MLPGSAMPLWTIVYVAYAMFVLAASSESDHAQRRNFVAEKKIRLTLTALEHQQQVRNGLVRATLPAPLLRAWYTSTLPSGTNAHQEPETLVVCVTVHQPLGTNAAGVTGFGTEQLIAVERAAERSHVLHIVKVVGDLCVLVSPIAEGRGSTEGYRTTMQALPTVLRVLLDLCSSGRYAAVMDIDTSIQIVSNVGIPSFSVFGVVLTRLLAIATATRDTWSGLRTLDHNLATIRSDSKNDDIVGEPYLPLRIRGAGMFRLLKLKLKCL